MDKKYRKLKIGERIRGNDEFWDGGCGEWRKIKKGLGFMEKRRFSSNLLYKYRRRITTQHPQTHLFK